MGFLDGILGALGGQNGSLGQAAINLVQSHGGLNGLLEQLRRSGLGAQADSWVGTGQNLPVTAEQIHAALGAPQVQALAARFGLSTDAIAGGLAQMLPTIVDHLTPNGQVPDAAALENALTHLKTRLGS
jgi:uncharacterized protein YidB (DUF937 family)